MKNVCLVALCLCLPLVSVFAGISCPNCGEDIPSDSYFCKFCGEEIPPQMRKAKEKQAAAVEIKETIVEEKKTEPAVTVTEEKDSAEKIRQLETRLDKLELRPGKAANPDGDKTFMTISYAPLSYTGDYFGYSSRDIGNNYELVLGFPKKNYTWFLGYTGMSMKKQLEGIEAASSSGANVFGSIKVYLE